MFYIKAVGDWTKRLKSEVGRCVKGDTDPLEIRVRGPFGAPAQHVECYDRVVLISGGIGATPFVSVCKHIFNLNESKTSQTRKCVQNCTLEQSSQQTLQSLEIVKSMDLVGRSFKDMEHARRPESTTTSTPRTANLLRSCANCIDNVATAQTVRRHVNMNKRSRAKQFLRSVSVSSALCVTMILRLFLIGLMGIFKPIIGHIMPGRGEAMSWLTLLDVLLGAFIVGTLIVIVFADVVSSQLGFFSDFDGVIDVVLLVPFAILSNVTGIYVLLQGSKAITPVIELLHFTVGVGGTTMLMMYRLGRIIWSRISLADRASNSNSVGLTSMDFIWITPTEDSDEWIRDELQPLSDGTSMRLHRYVTRVNRDEDPEAGQPVMSPQLITNYGYVTFFIAFFLFLSDFYVTPYRPLYRQYRMQVTTNGH